MESSVVKEVGERGGTGISPQTEFSNLNNYDVIIASTATIGHTAQ